VLSGENLDRREDSDKKNAEHFEKLAISISRGGCYKVGPSTVTSCSQVGGPFAAAASTGGSTTTPTVPRSSSQEVNSSDSEASHGRVPPCAMPLETTEGPTFPASTSLDNDIVIGRLDAL